MRQECRRPDTAGARSEETIPHGQRFHTSPAVSLPGSRLFRTSLSTRRYSLCPVAVSVSAIRLQRTSARSVSGGIVIRKKASRFVSAPIACQKKAAADLRRYLFRSEERGVGTA